MSIWTLGEGGYIKVTFDQSLIGTIADNEQHFTVSWQENEYAPNGPVTVSKSFNPESTGLGESDTNLILTMASTQQFNNAAVEISHSQPGAKVSINDAANGMPLNNLTISIMPVQAGSGDPSPNNIRPISGWTGCNVWRTGKNLLPAKLDRVPTEVSGVVWSTNLDDAERLRSFEANGTPNTNAPFNVNAAYYNNSLLLKAGEHYTLSGCPAGGGSNSFRLYRQSFGAEYYDDGTGADFPVQDTDSACDIRMTVYKNFQADGLEFHPMIRFSDSPAGYEPYCGDKYTIPFPAGAGTVYGGTLDLSSGVLTVTMRAVPISDVVQYCLWSDNYGIYYFRGSVSGGAEGNQILAISSRYAYAGRGTSANLPRLLSDRNYTFAAQYTNAFFDFRDDGYADDTLYPTMADKLAAFKAANADQLLVFAIQTPRTYQLTPQQIAALSGINNIWADTGDILSLDYWRQTPIRVQYDGLGRLRGLGGPVEAFDETFVPVGLIQKPSQKVAEHIEISNITFNGQLMAVDYTEGKAAEHIEISNITFNGALIDVGDL